MTVVEACCNSAAFILSIWSFIVTFVGIVMAYVSKPALMEVASKLGTGAEDVVLAGQIADIGFLVVLAVNLVAMVPIIEANQGCRKRMFGGHDEGGCMNCCRNCIQALIGVWLTRLIELLMFFCIVAMLAVSYVFVFGFTIANFLEAICSVPAAVEPAKELIESLHNSTVSFIQDLDIDAYCGVEEPHAAGLWLVIGCMLTVLAQPLTLAAIARAKESIVNTIEEGREVYRRSTTVGLGTELQENAC